MSMDSFAVVSLIHTPSTSPPINLLLFLFVVLRQRPCPIKISLKVSQRDKHKMVETYHAKWDKQNEDTVTCWDDLPPSERLPPLRYSETDTDGWEDLDVSVLYFYAGLIPCVGKWDPLPRISSSACSLISPFIRDLLQWPLGIPNDGSIDVAVQETTSALSLVGQMGTAPQGGQYWSNSVRKVIFSHVCRTNSLRPFLRRIPPPKNIRPIATLLQSPRIPC